MAHILEPLFDPEIERVVIDIALHLNPANLRRRILEEISSMEAPETDIILGYGLCGRALEGVASQKSRLILPRVDDCIGALLGSRQRHQALLTQIPGCYFIEPAWLGTQLDVFNECTKGLERIPENRRSQIIKMTLRHYSNVGLFTHGTPDTQALAYCRDQADEHGLKLVTIPSELRLLRRLAGRQWPDEDFVCVRPGREIPFF
jgi:hypothetical protein